MAKLETPTDKKPKGKKRKHCSAETEDEVANKSIIVEARAEDEPMQINTESARVLNTKKSKKRLNTNKGEILEKRVKSDQNDEDIATANEDHVLEDESQQPTLDEIKESEKPENNLAIATGRQKKKQKHQNLLEAQKGQSIEKEKRRNSEYLYKWKYQRDSWKFEKLRQISIQQTMFDIDKLDANIWPIALEYLAGSKGSAKDKIVKLANDSIEEVDKLCEQQETEHERQNILNSIRYQRARDLLQIFD